MRPEEIAQKLARDVFKDSEAILGTTDFEWWRLFVVRWAVMHADVLALPDLPSDARRELELAVGDVQSAVEAYVLPKIQALRQIDDGPRVREALERLGNVLSRLPGRGDWPPEVRALSAIVFSGDPRMAEVEFMRSLEREGSKTYHLKHGDPDLYFGLPAQGFRELVLDLLCRGLLNGPATRPVGLPVGPSEIESLYRNAQEISDLMEEKPVALRLNHRGRSHLWQLRDDLLLARDREDFGILWNKRAWQRALPLHLNWASDQAPVAVLFLDLDHFKSVNDTHGHPKGDEVLQLAFTLIRDLVADAGEAFRYGGEEVGVILPNASLQAARTIAESIRSAIEKEVGSATGLPGAQTISIGIGHFSAPVPASEAFAFVDKRLYAAKAGGRNRVEEATWLPR